MGQTERFASDVWEETLRRMRACFNFDEPRREKHPPHSQLELRSSALDSLVKASRSPPREQAASVKAMT